MALQLDTTTPGLWTDPDRDGQPSTHAVVIGVSEYRHLEHGSGPTAANTYGLGQLAVSALTAYRFFEWLRDGYHYEWAELGSVRLLLAPNAEELTEEPAMAASYAPADYDTCELALNAWHRHLAGLGPAAPASRSVFFFSGHGLEISQQQQILLPTDYLNPDRPSVNRALSILNLKQGMLTLEVPDQFFFIDACRNGSRQLGGTVIKGAEIFDVHSPHENNELVNSAAMYGTASGSQSWQPGTVGEGLSLFGDALLEAVRGGAPVDSVVQPPTVWFQDVAAFTNQQIANLLRQRGAQVRQTIKGDLAFIGLVHGGQESVIGTIGRPSHPVRRGRSASDRVPGGVVGGVDFKDLVFGDYVEPDHGWVSFGPDANSHDWFGREMIEAMWMGSTQAVEVRSGSVAPITVHGVDRFDVVSHRVTFSIDSEGPAWLTVDAPNGRYGALLPGYRDARYALGMDWDGDALVQLDIDLSVDSVDALRVSAELWEQYRYSDAGTAAEEILRTDDLAEAVGVVMSKVATKVSPLAAVVSSLVLLHAGRWRDLPIPWAENMARLPQFQDLPDGAVVWAELLNRMRRRSPERPEVALALLDERDLVPLTGDGLSFAMALAGILRETMEADDPNRPAVEAVGDRLSTLAPYIHPGGLFLVLAGPPAEIDRSLVYRSVDR